MFSDFETARLLKKEDLEKDGEGYDLVAAEKLGRSKNFEREGGLTLFDGEDAMLVNTVFGRETFASVDRIKMDF